MSKDKPELSPAVKAYQQFELENLETRTSPGYPITAFLAGFSAGKPHWQREMLEKNSHDEDCTIYANLSNDFPEAGICACGYGWQLVRAGNCSQMYSKELQAKLEAEVKDD